MSIFDKSFNEATREDYINFNKECRDKNVCPITTYINKKLEGKPRIYSKG